MGERRGNAGRLRRGLELGGGDSTPRRLILMGPGLLIERTGLISGKGERTGHRGAGAVRGLGLMVRVEEAFQAQKSLKESSGTERPGDCGEVSLYTGLLRPWVRGLAVIFIYIHRKAYKI